MKLIDVQQRDLEQIYQITTWDPTLPPIFFILHAARIEIDKVTYFGHVELFETVYNTLSLGLNMFDFQSH